jgi:riboflavin synthase
MFTGIIEELGSVVAVVEQPDAAKLTVRAPLVLSDARLGDSIAVNGVCLTVVDTDGQSFTADVMRQTLDLSTLAAVVVGDHVNLERPLQLSGRLGGHMVSGHVDGVGHILSRDPSAHWDVVRIELPDHLNPYVVDQGSITVDGVSLTVVEVSEAGKSPTWFSVSLIPETLERTTLGLRAVGDRVNLEVDVIAKYVERQLTWRSE